MELTSVRVLAEESERLQASTPVYSPYQSPMCNEVSSWQRELSVGEGGTQRVAVPRVSVKIRKREKKIGQEQREHKSTGSRYNLQNRSHTPVSVPPPHLSTCLPKCPTKSLTEDQLTPSSISFKRDFLFLESTRPFLIKIRRNYVRRPKALSGIRSNREREMCLATIHTNRGHCGGEENGERNRTPIGESWGESTRVGTRGSDLPTRLFRRLF